VDAGRQSDQIGPLIETGASDWTEHPIRYECTGGAFSTRLRKCEDKTLRDLMLFIEFHKIVVRDKIPIDAAHREFLKIDEYQERISPDVMA
jgi:hypothetical protein